MGLESLASLFGGGGGSLSPSSSTAQNTPFYNEAGIFFDSPGAGNISGNTADASATTPRSQAGGINPLPYSQLPSNTAAVANNGSSIYLLIFGGLIVAVGIIWFVLKKK